MYMKQIYIIHPLWVFPYFDKLYLKNKKIKHIPCGPSMMDCLFIGNLSETCQKPARNLPKTSLQRFLAGFRQVSGRFPAGFRRFPEVSGNPSLTDHTVLSRIWSRYFCLSFLLIFLILLTSHKFLCPLF